MKLELENKNVLVTGSSKGIGLAIAKTFLGEGSNVCIISRGSKDLFTNEKKLKNQYGANKIFAKKCDCTKISELKKLRDNILYKWGKLDIVVINVGDGKSIKDIIPSDLRWKKTWDKNFETALYTARVFLPIVKKTKGVLLFISSIAGVQAFGAPTDYSVAKTAIISLAKNLAIKSAPSVRINVIAPGNVLFSGGSWDKKIKQNKKIVEEMINHLVPMKRFATPEEIADTAVFLCSKRASFITGETLIVDGGQSKGII